MCTSLGNCLDDAITENFFETLKSKLSYPKKYNSIKQLAREIRNNISYYNNDRISERLKGMSPIEYQAHYSN